MSTDPLDGESIVAESAGQTWDGLPAETVMGHVHLHVANLKETEKFYNALGFEIVSSLSRSIVHVYWEISSPFGLNTWNGEGAQRPSANSVGLKWLHTYFSG